MTCCTAAEVKGSTLSVNLTSSTRTLFVVSDWMPKLWIFGCRRRRLGEHFDAVRVQRQFVRAARAVGDNPHAGAQHIGHDPQLQFGSESVVAPDHYLEFAAVVLEIVGMGEKQRALDLFRAWWPGSPARGDGPDVTP